MQAQYYQIEAERLQLSSSFGQVSIPIPYSSSMSLFSKILPVIRAEFKKTIQQPTNDLHNAPKPSLLTDMCPSTVWQATSSFSTPWYTPGLTSPTLVKYLFLLSHFFTSRAFYNYIFTIINTLSHVPYGLCTVCIPRCPTGKCSKKWPFFMTFAIKGDTKKNWYFLGIFPK